MGLTNQIKRGFHKHRQATLEGNIWMMLKECYNCGRLCIKDILERGCAWHGVERQIKNIFPFLTIKPLGQIDLKGDRIQRYELTYIQHEDLKNRCHDCGRRKKDHLMANSYTCWRCFSKEEREVK